MERFPFLECNVYTLTCPCPCYLRLVIRSHNAMVHAMWLESSKLEGYIASIAKHNDPKRATPHDRRFHILPSEEWVMNGRECEIEKQVTNRVTIPHDSNAAWEYDVPIEKNQKQRRSLSIQRQFVKNNLVFVLPQKLLWSNIRCTCLHTHMVVVLLEVHSQNRNNNHQV